MGYLREIRNKLNSLEVEEFFDIEEFVIWQWGMYTNSTRRSFDVFLVHAKKEMPEKLFKTNRGRIYRIQ